MHAEIGVSVNVPFYMAVDFLARPGEDGVEVYVAVECSFYERVGEYVAAPCPEVELHGRSPSVQFFHSEDRCVDAVAAELCGEFGLEFAEFQILVVKMAEWDFQTRLRRGEDGVGHAPRAAEADGSVHHHVGL